jgi:hypothetical protein
MTAGEWSTIGVFVLAAASLLSTISFYRWTRRQRRPEPTVIDCSILKESAEDAVHVIIWLFNPGSVSVLLDGLAYKGWIGKHSIEAQYESFAPDNASLVAPNELKRLQIDLPESFGRVLFSKFGEEAMRRGRVHMRFLFGYVAGDAFRITLVKGLRAQPDPLTGRIQVRYTRGWLWHPCETLRSEWSKLWF